MIDLLALTALMEDPTGWLGVADRYGAIGTVIRDDIARAARAGTTYHVFGR